MAGIVGEMLTELFLLGRQQLTAIATELRADASAFGEGLQLVNILKDSDADVRDGRRYLPLGTDPARVFELAFTGLDAASRYCMRLEAAGAERGILAFNAFPVVLARATLDPDPDPVDLKRRAATLREAIAALPGQPAAGGTP